MCYTLGKNYEPTNQPTNQPNLTARAFVKKSLKFLLKPAAHLFRYAVRRAIYNELDLLRGGLKYTQKILADSPLTDALRLEMMLYENPHANIPRPIIKNAEETLYEILNTQKSFVRYGDGEITLMLHNSKAIPFQEYNPALAQRLMEILQNPVDDLMLGINHHYFYPYLHPNIVGNSNYDKNFKVLYIPKLRHHLNAWLNPHTTYYDASLFFNITHIQFAALREFFRGKHVVLTLCKEALNNYKFNVFDSAAKIDYVFIPNKHAFRKYDETLAHLAQFPKTALHILMAGPTANIWAADLHALGFRALDLGHIAKSYDYLMQNKPQDEEFWKPDE